MRRIIGGDDSSLILHQELRSLTKEEQGKLLLDAGLTIDIPPEQGLAMKADLAIPWNKLRVIRRLILIKHTAGIQSHVNNVCRWLSSSGVSLSSKRKQQKIAQQQVGDNLETETAPFSFSLASGGEELRAAAHVFIPNLVEKVIQLLEQNEKYF